MPRLVRRKPWTEKVKAMLNPMDFLLWASEELETSDWDSKTIGTQIGLASNFVFLLARANSAGSDSGDDIFSEGGSSNLTTFLIRPLVWILALLCLANSVFTMTRSRHYRLFEASVDRAPQTPSAQRVKVQSSPVASSPLRYITSMMAPESADSRAHPDKTRDVWEISVWDPLPVCMQLFCFFSPGHVLVYMLYLPLETLDARPSVTVFNAIVLQVIMSVQLLFLQTRFSQQIKDTAIIQKEVLHEYDTKFVHPRIHPVMRDVGTQMSTDDSKEDRDFVELGTPTTIIKREFQTHANPNYARHVDPNYELDAFKNHLSPRMHTPRTQPQPRRSEAFTPMPASRQTPSRQSLPAGYQAAPARSSATPQVGTTMATNAGTQFGGSMGLFSHSNSPLKKTTSLHDMGADYKSPRNSSEMAALEQQRSSPSKQKENRRVTMGTHGMGPSSTTGVNPFANTQRSRASERYPKMWGRE